MYFGLAKSFTEVIRREKGRMVKAVDGVNLSIEAGTVVGLVGESGCGKTTLGKVIAGLYRPTSGTVLYRPSEGFGGYLKQEGRSDGSRDGLFDIAGMNHQALRRLRRETQIVLQDPYGALNPRMMVREIIEEPLVIDGTYSASERAEMVSKALDEVRLTPAEEFVGRYPFHLSGGQRQRVNLARAIILRPRLIVADEPVSMLDVSIRAEILKLMMDLRKELNLTYLMITHDLAVAGIVCDYINVMYLGKIVESGPADEVLTNPQHPYTKALLAAVPSPDPRGRWSLKEVPITGEVPSATNIPAGCRFNPRCPYVMDICKNKVPDNFGVGPEHWAACWLVEKQSTAS